MQRRVWNTGYVDWILLYLAAVWNKKKMGDFRQFFYTQVRNIYIDML